MCAPEGHGSKLEPNGTMRQDDLSLAQMVEAAPDIMGTCDAQGQLTYLNRAGRERLGLTEIPVGALGVPCIQFYPPAVATMIREVALAAATRDGVWRGESALYAGDGREWPVEQVIFVHRDASGAVAGFSTIIRDVAAQRLAEKALRDSEERFSKAFYASADPYVIVDHTTHQMVDVNDAFCRRFGVAREEAIGKANSELGLWADLAQRDRFIEIMNRDGEVHGMEQHRRTRTGETVICLVTAFRIDIGGRSCTLYEMRDITRERQSERALRESEELFSKVFRGSPHPVLVTEAASGKIIEANERFCEFMGRDREGIIGRTARDFRSWVDHAERDGLYALILQHGSVRDREVHLFNHEGDIRLGRFSGELIDLRGQKCVVSVFEDLTDLKRAQQALAASEEKFSRAFQASPDSVVISTFEEGRILDVNEGFTRLHGWTRNEAIGRTGPDLGLWGDLSYRRQVVDLLRAGRTVHSLPVVARNRAGTLHQCLYSAETTEIGSTRCIISIIRDVTEQQRLEEQLRHAQKMESVGQLAGGVAHDFNNILTVIQGHTSLLLGDSRLPPEVIESLRQIDRSADFAAKLTRQLLLFGRKQMLQPGRLALNDVVSRVTRLLERVIGENIELELDLASGLPEILADAGMVDQVLLNLVVNARDAMPAGGRVTISTRQHESDAEYVRRIPQARCGHFVGLRVRDTGEGIAPDILPRIFDPFFTTKKEGKGTGLGLATAYGIVEQHSGWIEVESRPGHGAQFTAWFPAMAASALEPRPVSKPPLLVRGGETILVVEDKDAVRAIIRAVLTRFGYQVVLAADGLEALTCWAEHKDQIRLLFTDVVMPGSMTGKDLAERLRVTRPDLKVIFCSGYDADIIDPAVLKVPGTRFLAKPFDVGNLAQTVRELLNAG